MSINYYDDHDYWDAGPNWAALMQVRIYMSKRGEHGEREESVTSQPAGNDDDIFFV